MKFLPLVWRNLLRRKVRTTFTLGSIFIAFVLYAFLMTIRSAFSMGVDMAGVDRLMMMHKVSLLQLLPLSYKKDILSTPGVKLASSSTWLLPPATASIVPSAEKVRCQTPPGSPRHGATRAGGIARRTDS